MYLPLDSKDPNPYKYNSAVSFLHVWVRKEVNINILASDVNGTILRLPVPVESLVLIGWENYFQNEERPFEFLAIEFLAFRISEFRISGISGFLKF